jgi:hypothetical protein
MHLLDTITITLAGLMVGNELAVSAFVNPAVWQLGSGAQARELSILACSLGRVIPIWLACVWPFLHWSRSCIAIRLRCSSAHGDTDLGGSDFVHHRHAFCRLATALLG